MNLDYRMRGRIEKAGSTAVSAALHLLLAALLIRYAVFQPTPESADMTVVDIGPTPLPPTLVPRPPPIIDPNETFPLEPPPEPIPYEDPPAAPDPDVERNWTGVDMPRILPVGPVVEIGPIREFRDRYGQGRLEAAQRFRVPGGVTQSVNRALEWLKAHQLDDGAWEGEDRTAMTGLALLTFLAHGETTGSERYGATVERALRRLLAAQDDGGRFSANVYAHAIATYAVSESFALTRIPDLKPAMVRGVQVILDGQQPGGGWDYQYARKARRDTSVAGWQIQALKAAHIAGADQPGLDAAMARAVADLQSVQDEETGRFAYAERGQGGSDGVTGVGALSLLLLGRIGEKPAARGVDALAGLDCDWANPPPWALYTWYYVTQANFHYSDHAWARWKDKFTRALVRHQNGDGSWTAPGNEQKYGPVYSTTLAALTLQVYARTLPTYQAVAVREPPPPARDEDDIRVREM